MRRKIPAGEWCENPLEGFLKTPALAEPKALLDYRRKQVPLFFLKPAAREDFSSFLAEWDARGDSPVALVEKLVGGDFRYFEGVEAAAGFPPDWHRHPFTGECAPADVHWSEIGDFQFGDLKVIWEPNRFGFGYALVRAYRRTGDERYPEIFWQLVEDWRDQNPPQSGVNWKCGQEISFRVMAWLFGLYGFLESPATTAERVATLAQMVAVSAKRIEANLDYALSQRNNHGISEGVGLWTVGLMFPEFRQSAEWSELGRGVLERSGRDLIYDDGSFAQHSVNYHRLMLHDFLWAIRLGDLHGQPLSGALRERLAKAWNWLFQMQDEISGRAPNYGQNDGALVLPLNNCDYRNFRPVLQAVHYLCTGTRCYPPGPWDEDLFWLFGPEALEAPTAPPERTPLQADQGGYYTLRSSEGFALVRCASFNHRPGQADMLHVDLWWRGQNVALDAGTYSYNAPAPWNNSLAHTAYHNTVSVDGLDQMERVGKFLWLPWLKGQVTRFEPSDKENLTHWEGEHDGYRRLKYPVSHRRAILQLPGEKWVMLDKLKSPARHRYRLHWLLMDVPYEWDEERGRLALHTESGPFFVQVGVSALGWEASLVRADSSSARGWHSPYYNYREPALSLAVSVESPACFFWSVFGPNADASLDSVRRYKQVDQVVKRFSSS
jgi:asparagine synthase (glutamine-hydrolysing)